MFILKYCVQQQCLIVRKILKFYFLFMRNSTANVFLCTQQKILFTKKKKYIVAAKNEKGKW